MYSLIYIPVISTLRVFSIKTFEHTYQYQWPSDLSARAISEDILKAENGFKTKRLSTKKAESFIAYGMHKNVLL